MGFFLILIWILIFSFFLLDMYLYIISNFIIIIVIVLDIYIWYMYFVENVQLIHLLTKESIDLLEITKSCSHLKRVRLSSQGNIFSPKNDVFSDDVTINNVMFWRRIYKLVQKQHYFWWCYNKRRHVLVEKMCISHQNITFFAHLSLLRVSFWDTWMSYPPSVVHSFVRRRHQQFSR